MRAYSRSLRLATSKIKYDPVSPCVRCVNTLNRPTPRRKSTYPTCLLRNPATTVQRRSFISLFMKTEESLEDKAYEQNPGIRVLATLMRYHKEQIGFEPTSKELVAAVAKMAVDKAVFAAPGNVSGMIKAFEVLKERGDLKYVYLHNIRLCLKHLSYWCEQRSYPGGDIKFAEHLLYFLIDETKPTQQPTPTDYLAFITILAQYGKLEDAMAVCRNGTAQYGVDGVPGSVWLPIMSSYLKQDDEQGLLRVLDELEQLGVPILFDNYRPMIQLYIARKDHANVRKWYNKIIDERVPVGWKVYQDIFSAYTTMGGDESEAAKWTGDLIRGVLDTFSGKPSNTIDATAIWTPEDAKVIWALALRWCLAKGKNVDEIDKLMRAVRDYQSSQFEPDTWTINLLVMYAIEKKDPYLAERLVELGHRWGFTPDRKSYTLQVEYRLLANDLEGARTAWEELEYFEKVEEDEGLETKALLKATVVHPLAEPHRVSEIYTNILDRNVSLDVDTLSPLLLFYMRHNDIPTFVSVLTREVLNYTPKDRETIINLIAEYMGAPTTPVSDAWPIYEMLKEVFLELAMPTRTEIMKMFFAKGRPDMGVVVFTHMRMSKNARPDHRAYRDAILGVGDYRDAEGLFQLHDMLKIDTELEPNTEIRNALMLAYELIDDPRKSLEVFKTIMESIEGPDQNTLSLAMTACGHIAGEMQRKGEKVWNWFIKHHIMPTEINYSWYITAWQLNGEFDKAFEIVKTMEKDHGVRPGPRCLLSLYAEHHELRRGEVEKWAKEKYPDVWAELENAPDLLANSVAQVQARRERVYL